MPGWPFEDTGQSLVGADALDALRDRFGDDTIVRRVGKTLQRQGPSKLD